MKRMSLMIALVAASAMIFTGCETKNGAGDGDALGAGDGSAYGAGGDVGVDPNDAGFDPNDPNVGAFGSDRFEDTRERVLDADLAPLYFTFDSYTMPMEEQAKADAAAEYLLENPSHVMIIEGHCDERGSNEYNLSLSEQRAIGVRDYLQAYGIAPARIQTRAFGEEKPADPGHDEAAFRKNRRAEFVPYK